MTIFTLLLWLDLVGVFFSSEDVLSMVDSEAKGAGKGVATWTKAGSGSVATGGATTWAETEGGEIIERAKYNGAVNAAGGKRARTAQTVVRDKKTMNAARADGGAGTAEVALRVES